MTRYRRSFLALPVALLAADAAAQSASWFPVEGADKSFFVEMPGAPVYKVLDTVSAGGTPFVYHSYSLEYRRLSFVAQSALFPADVDVRQPKVNLQSALDDRALRLAGAKWTSVDWKTVQGAPAVESTGPLAGGNALRQLVVLKGRQYVSLGYLAPADALRAPEAERFFRSLRLLS
ncbi:MAG: hypothetical protein EPO41_09550 [Reyranella sp.]|uniref:hypothetical protein n=1 Tax=Reyranella sp. TaxID=1929291 RepID=UPI00120074CD|nr:hypothetical protein [Reyranella sp.]TAJ95472.1 MAG: hypothetical protein EPO41_09550 [Reyranella sp.]